MSLEINSPTMIKPLAMRDVFLNRIWQSMEKEKKIFFVSADFGSPVLDKIRADFPERFINVGIAEQNLINVTAGLALEGYKVFAYAIAPFITMRCYEQIRVSLALLSEVRPMNVNLIGVGAGYSYVVSGPTHQCYEDITLMRSLPNFTVLSPSDHIAAAALFDHCLGEKGLRYFRFDAQILPVIYEESALNIQKGFHIHRTGERICLISTGYMLHTAIKVADRLQKVGVKVGVIDLFDLTHFAPDALQTELSKYAGIVSLEEGFKGCGGMDSMLFAFIAQHNLPLKMLNIGVEGKYRFELGTRQELHEQVGVGENVALENIKKFINLINLMEET